MKFENRKLIFSGIVVLLVVLLVLLFYNQYRIKHATIYVELEKNRTVEVYDKVYVSNFIKKINGKIVEDYLIDTTKVGEKEIIFSFINNQKIKVSYQFQIYVQDSTPPIIGVSNYTVVKGYTGELAKEFFCGDNYDDNPSCTIEGNYDINTLGSYRLKFKAVDRNQNENSANFTLTVIEKPDNTSTTTKSTKTEFLDVVKMHKNDKTMIGIDVSYHQGDIDFQKVKDSKVEFAFIRIGTENSQGQLYLDKKFQEYIEGFHKVGIPVGIYYYSYADSIEKALKEAKWVIKHMKKYKIELPVVFDWENWSKYQHYHLSFYHLTEVANTFLSTVKKSGYEVMLYSSKYYLENIWYPINSKIWLAHYTMQTNYAGNYYVWQLCSNGHVNGIEKNAVDIDVLYK